MVVIYLFPGNKAKSRERYDLTSEEDNVKRPGSGRLEGRAFGTAQDRILNVLKSSCPAKVNQ